MVYQLCAFILFSLTPYNLAALLLCLKLSNTFPLHLLQNPTPTGLQRPMWYALCDRPSSPSPNLHNSATLTFFSVS